MCFGSLPEPFYFFAFYSEKGRISKSIAELQAGKAVILWAKQEIIICIEEIAVKIASIKRIITEI